MPTLTDYDRERGLSSAYKRRRTARFIAGVVAPVVAASGIAVAASGGNHDGTPRTSTTEQSNDYKHMLQVEDQMAHGVPHEGPDQVIVPVETRPNH